jgi:hypothetical protein
MTRSDELDVIRSRAEYWRTRELGVRGKLGRCLTSLGEHDLGLDDITEDMLARWMSASFVAIRTAGGTLLADQYLATLQRTFAAAQALRRCNDAGEVNRHATEALEVAMHEFAGVNAAVTALLDGNARAES